MILNMSVRSEPHKIHKPVFNQNLGSGPAKFENWGARTPSPSKLSAYVDDDTFQFQFQF